MADYWLKDGAFGEEIGPYNGKLVKQFAAENRIGPEWLVSSDREKWHRAGSVKGLFVATAEPAQGGKPAGKRSPAIAALLIDSEKFPLEPLQAQMQRHPSPGQRELSLEKGILSFGEGDAVVAVAPMPAPYPWRDLEGPVATAWMWPKGTSAVSVKRHRSHVLVTIVGGTLSPIPRRLLLTRITAMAAQQPGVMGVYWCEGTLVHHPKIFIEMGQKITSPKAPPLHLWVDYRLERNADKSTRLFTTGLDGLGLMEIEIPAVDMNPAELRDWAVNITYYLIDKGPVLKHGDTIGIDADHQMRIRHSPSMYDSRGKKPVLRIERQ